MSHLLTNELKDEKRWPPSIVFQLSDLMRVFKQRVVRYPLRAEDYEEILRQVFDLLLNFGPNARNSYPYLPDTSRLIGVMDLELGTELGCGLNQACIELAHGIHARIDELQLWREHPRGFDCPYYFERFTRQDAVLDHLAY